MAGPCSVESRDQLMETADAVAAAGRRSCGRRVQAADEPVQLPGAGRRGAPLPAEAREETGLPVVTEVMDRTQVDIVAEYADILQIGTRNMQNYSLLSAVGRRQAGAASSAGYGATVEEWLMAAEYIVSPGQPRT